MANNRYDIVVIGGGPAGMMAAGTAAARKAKVLLLEKNRITGQKLLITGAGRCNLTNAEKNVKNITRMFGKNGNFLYTALNTFGVDETIAFFYRYGMRTAEEREGKIFPESGDAETVRQVLLSYMADNGVQTRCGVTVTDISITENGCKITTSEGETISAGKVILTTGGMSYPTTGSTGDGFRFATALGHTITPLRPALTPLNLQHPRIAEMEGLSLRDARLSLFAQDKKLGDETGDLVFTRGGISGPAPYGLSRIFSGHDLTDAVLKIDLHPAEDHAAMDARILALLTEHSKKQVKSIFDMLFPGSMAPVALGESGMDPEMHASRVSKAERRLIIRLLKEFPFPVQSFGGFSRATITAGGVSLKEVEQKTMQSKLHPALYFAGEILDLDGPTGGFNLQVCWSTGHLAGKSATESVSGGGL